MKNQIRKSPLSGMLVSASALGVLIAPLNSLGDISVSSPDIHWADGQTVVADEEAATSGSVLANLFAPMGLPANADVDAVHGLASGDVLFSLETTLELGGIVYRPSDVIRFNGESWTKELDGLSSGIPAGVNVDAIAMSAESLLLSLDVGAELDSMAVSDADIIAYNGKAFSIVLRANEVGINAAADVDALHLDDQGRLLMSFDGSGEVGGIHYRDEDVLALNSTVWSKGVDNNAAAWGPVDLDAWSVVFLDNTIFSDGFESDDLK